MRQRTRHVQYMRQRCQNRDGFTMVELMAGSLIATMVAGGTMMAYVTAARISRQQGNPAIVEATMLAQQTLERFRSEMACDADSFDPVTCNAKAVLPTGDWTTDDFPNANSNDPAIAARGNESILTRPGTTPKRCFRVTKEDCDGDGLTGDCFAVQAKVCWGDTTTCPCP